MKKCLLLISCSIIAAQAAVAMTAEEQLSNMKDMFVKEFQKMDTDKNGTLSRDEYLTYQFETFRANIISAEGFDKPVDLTETPVVIKEEPKETPETAEPAENEDVVLGGASSALQAMADFKLEDLEDEDDKAVTTLTKDDVLPDDLSIITDDLLQTEQATTQSEETKAEPVVDEEAQINEMIKTIQGTLPKKIDEITTWTDIQYADKVINYIYTADIDVSEYSPGEYAELTENIQKDACVKANTDMCPKVKPMFIDRGIDMKIKYLDKKSEKIGECEFNNQTCQ